MRKFLICLLASVCFNLLAESGVEFMVDDSPDELEKIKDDGTTKKIIPVKPQRQIKKRAEFVIVKAKQRSVIVAPPKAMFVTPTIPVVKNTPMPLNTEPTIDTKAVSIVAPSVRSSAEIPNYVLLLPTPKPAQVPRPKTASIPISLKSISMSPRLIDSIFSFSDLPEMNLPRYNVAPQLPIKAPAQMGKAQPPQIPNVAPMVPTTIVKPISKIAPTPKPVVAVAVKENFWSRVKSKVDTIKTDIKKEYKKEFNTVKATFDFFKQTFFGKPKK